MRADYYGDQYDWEIDRYTTTTVRRYRSSTKGYWEEDSQLIYEYNDATVKHIRTQMQCFEWCKGATITITNLTQRVAEDIINSQHRRANEALERVDSARLEHLVISGVRRWTKQRLALQRALKEGRLVKGGPSFLLVSPRHSARSVITVKMPLAAEVAADWLVRQRFRHTVGLTMDWKKLDYAVDVAIRGLGTVRWTTSEDIYYIRVEHITDTVRSIRSIIRQDSYSPHPDVPITLTDISHLADA